MNDNKTIRPKESVVLITDAEKLSRIIELTMYMTQKIISNRGSVDKYQPHNQDEDQIFREECFLLRKELKIIDEDGKLIPIPSVLSSSQNPPKGVADGISGT